MQNLNLIQEKIKSEKIEVLMPQCSYKLEVRVNTSKLDEIPILGNPFLTKLENGQVTLACIEYSSLKQEERINLLVKEDSNLLAHLERGTNIWFRRIVSSPNAKELCWETRPAYLEDLEEMDTNAISDSDALILYNAAFDSNNQRQGVNMQNQDKSIVNEDLEKIQIWESDLGTNFSGYPLENMANWVADEVREVLLENNCTRFTKNKKFKLKMIMEEYK